MALDYDFELGFDAPRAGAPPAFPRAALHAFGPAAGEPSRRKIRSSRKTGPTVVHVARAC